MWLCLSNGFLSIVQDKNVKNQFLVRAREKTHLEFYFPNVDIIDNVMGDYPYRIFIQKSEFMEFLSNYVESINYDNFKNSVTDQKLHYFFLKIWSFGISILEKKIMSY